MATTIQTSVRINAPVEKVWEIFSDFSAYESWNPFIRSLEVKGTPQTGDRIRVQLTPPGQRGMTFTPKVIGFRRCHSLEWVGKLYVPGLFDGRHRFELTAHPDGTTTFVQTETFRGILVPFLKRMLNGPTREGFCRMNEALRNRAETLNPASR